MGKLYWWGSWFAILLYLLILVVQPLTKAPFFDEYFVANPAYNLAAHGFPGTTGLEMTTNGWKGIDRHTFNTLPTGILALALLYKIFGFSLFITRSLSLVSGLLVLGTVYYLMLHFFTDDRRVAKLTCLLLATNYTFILAAGFGRVDMLTAALGLGAQGVYVRLRNDHLNLAVLLSCVLMVLCGLTHPNGVLYFLCLLFVAFYLDRGRLRPSHAGLALIPFAVGGAGWLAYVMQSVPDAAAQLSSNAADHDTFHGLKHPLQALVAELQERYLHGVFHHGGAPPTVAIRLKVVIFLAYLGGVVATLVIPSLRRTRASQLALGQTAIIFVVFWLFEGLKLPWYLLLSVPWYSALLATWLLHLWDRQYVPRMVIASCTAALIAVHVGGIAYRIYQDEYRTDYLPAVTFLKQRAAPADLVFARCDFGFGYGFERNLVEDADFGYLSHKSPKFVVVSPTVEWGIEDSERTKPLVYRHIQSLLSTYKLIYQHGTYKIFQKPA